MEETNKEHHIKSAHSVQNILFLVPIMTMQTGSPKQRILYNKVKPLLMFVTIT